MSGIKENELTIAIPTYNRKDDIIRLLKGIEQLDYQRLKEIIISDNHSSYNIESVLKENFSVDFLRYCRIIINPVNIGGPGNIKNQLLYCRSKWLWMIGDDDEVLPEALDIIFNDINNDTDCAFFRYSINIREREDDEIVSVVEENRKMCSLDDFMEYYEEKQRNKGNMVFMSNNIYNMELLAPYINYAFTYNTSITQLIPFFMGLDDGKIYGRYRDKKIVQFDGQKEGTTWSYIRVMGAVSTINQIPFKSLNKKQFKRFLKVINFVNLRQFMFWCLTHKEKIPRIDMVIQIYRNFYRYCSTVKDFIIYIVGLIELKHNIRIIPRSFLYKKKF